ncbi:glucose-1-phosphate adenylyltransferase [candidate division KSB1 bacterium]|nr:glucose-1-phosphate adenylyltransferase [candidate division KSB1 bacterium]
MRNTVAFLLAGGMGSRLNILGWMRAKPAVPFGGCYRLIDFTLSNAMYSGVKQIGILTQYRPYSLMGHIGSGEAWDLVGRTRCAKILPPSTGIDDYDWYRGTADAVAQNIGFATRYDAKRVLVLSGDHIYKMNYAPMVEFHKEKNARITIAMMPVPWEETRHFGTGITDKAQRIIDWEEKPEKAKSNMASMGVYVFDVDFLIQALKDRSGHDFGRHVIQDAIKDRNVFAYRFQGYWADVGTLNAYWQASMDILNPDSGLRLGEWTVRTNYDDESSQGDRTPARVGPHARVSNSVLSAGCVVDGLVSNSILSPGVRIEKDVQVHDSVIMQDSVIHSGAVLNQVIADKNVVVEADACIGGGDSEQPNEKFPQHLYSGLTVLGKNAHIPPKIKIFANTIVEPLANDSSFGHINLSVGSYIKR